MMCAFLFLVSPATFGILILPVGSAWKPPQTSGAIEELADVAVVDDFVFVLTDKGLHVLDVSNPRSVSEVGQLQFQWPAQNGILRFAVAGGYAFVICGNDHIYPVDLRTPSTPKLIRQDFYFTSGRVTAVDVAGGVCYVGV